MVVVVDGFKGSVSPVSRHSSSRPVHRDLEVMPPQYASVHTRGRGPYLDTYDDVNPDVDLGVEWSDESRVS